MAHTEYHQKHLASLCHLLEEQKRFVLIEAETMIDAYIRESLADPNKN